MKRTASPVAPTMRRYSCASGECPIQLRSQYSMVEVGETSIDQRTHEVLMVIAERACRTIRRGSGMRGLGERAR